jgi:hypothetical protein
MSSPLPNVAALGNWIHSWVQPNGAIHGFHNHPVWGVNPYRLGDFTAGHTTWSSPFLAGLAEAIALRPDPARQGPSRAPRSLPSHHLPPRRPV